MRNSSDRLLVNLLIVAAIVLASLYLSQSFWLKMVERMLNSSQSTGLPTSSTPISGFSFPRQRAPASLNIELTVGNLGITVTGIVSPANHVVGTANRFNVLEKDEEYLVVYIKTRCVSNSESCRVTEFDFGVHSDAGRDYPAELTTGFSDDLKFQSASCPYMGEALRNELRSIFNRLELAHPGVLFSAYHAMLKLRKLAEPGLAPSILQSCARCGEPTVSSICEACRMTGESALQMGALPIIQ